MEPGKDKKDFTAFKGFETTEGEEGAEQDIFEVEDLRGNLLRFVTIFKPFSIIYIYFSKYIYM
ncbi:MAG: hypothetical protein JSY10_12110 [Paenibacillus sp.]|nr:hypothetical protein [Paenibacillus sp.]